MVYDPKRFKEYQKRRLENGKGQTRKSNHTKGSAAFTRALLMPNSVKECVTKTRLELFGSQEPPFSDIEKMGEWLMEEHRTQPPAEGHAPRYGYRMEKDLTLEQLQAMNATRPGVYGLEFAKLPYPTKDNWTSNVIVSDGTRLRRLWLAVQYIAKELDCQEGQATALMLVGLLPLVSALSAKTPQTFRKDQPSSLSHLNLGIKVF